MFETARTTHITPRLSRVDQIARLKQDREWFARCRVSAARTAAMKYRNGMWVLCSMLGAWTLPTRGHAQANMAVAPDSVTGDALVGAASAPEQPPPRKSKRASKAAPSDQPPLAAPPKAAASDELSTPAAPPKQRSKTAVSDQASAQPRAASSHSADATNEEEGTEPAAAPPSRIHPKPRSKHAAHAVQPRPDRQPDPEYQRMCESWHAPIVAPVAPVSDDPDARPPLVIVPVNGGEQVSLHPEREDGGFGKKDLAVAARVFTPSKIKKPHAIAPHLLDLVYRAMRHFGAPLVRLVSGYRHDRPGSRHTQGRAIDMVLPGVSNEELVEYARQFGFCGVGIYPKSGFVHIDVRESSFFWVDESLPDERSRGVPVASQEADAADCAARDRGEHPQTFVPNNEREDKAAARAYEKRARRRAQLQRAAAE
jgi:hypothetical protein